MENLYDNEAFFAAYANMSRSLQGLEGAGEWQQFRALFPPLEGCNVLDLGCGYGWHCAFCADRGAASVLGLDSSKRMIAEANRKNARTNTEYRVCDITQYSYPEAAYHVVVSNLALHYIRELDPVFRGVFRTLKEGGCFLLNIERPCFTAGVEQRWHTDAAGTPLHWPVDNYFYPGERETEFVGHSVKKQHHTLTQILMGLRNAGFLLDVVEDAQPPENMMHLPGMTDEMRRPMMLLIRAVKPQKG